MIISFGSKETEQIWKGLHVKRLPLEVQNVGRRKLRMINNSIHLIDLKSPPANRLEKMLGNWKGFYSIRLNDQWRVVFRWDRGNASDVEIVDYH